MNLKRWLKLLPIPSKAPTPSFVGTKDFYLYLNLINPAARQDFSLPSVASAKEALSNCMQIVYVLKCNDGSFYTGCTSDLNERVSRHNAGYVESTRSRLPIVIAFSCAFVDKQKAFEFEKYLKSGSGIAFRNKHLI